MTLGSLMVDVAGHALTDDDRALLDCPSVGGLIFFKRNFENREQLWHLIEEIRRRRPELILAVDQEGGRVQRFRRDGFTPLPSMRALAAAAGQGECERNPLRETGWLMASEVLAAGVDISFAPVLDLDHGCSSVIGDRAFAESAEAVTQAARAFIAGMHEAGMAATGKHFPGHGAVPGDSHHLLPIDDRPLGIIEQRDLLPFAALIREGLDAVMPAHIVYSCVDAVPAGFSKTWLQSVLRQQLGFQGVIFSDDLSMAGAAFAGDFFQRCDAALEAGCDMVLVCNDRQAAWQLARHPDLVSAEASRRIERLRGRCSLSWHEVNSHPRTHLIRDWLAQIH